MGSRPAGRQRFHGAGKGKGKRRVVRAGCRVRGAAGSAVPFASITGKGSSITICNLRPIRACLQSCSCPSPSPLVCIPPHAPFARFIPLLPFSFLPALSAEPVARQVRPSRAAQAARRGAGGGQAAAGQAGSGDEAARGAECAGDSAGAAQRAEAAVSGEQEGDARV